MSAPSKASGREVKTSKPTRGAATNLEEEPSAAQSWQTAILDCTLCGLAVLATRCWTQQFQPRHGASWQDPWWAQYVEYAIIAAGKLIHLSQSSGNRSSEERRRLALPGLFLAIAWSQLFQYVLDSALVQWQVFAVKVAVFLPLVSYSWYRISNSSSAAAARSLQGASESTVSLVSNTFDMAAMYGLLRLQKEPADWMIASLPYGWLPAGFLFPLIVCAIAGFMALFAFTSLKRQDRKLSPYLMLLLVVIPLAHGLLINTHSPVLTAITALNARLSDAGYSVIARGDGRATGYVSVVQNNKDGFKVLRCDHSLLGGTWLEGQGLVKDPIYGIFVMLEAVRFVVPNGASRQVIKQAEFLAKSGNVLNIGLGVGTAPAAFIHHGMNVTIVEIDQIVYDYAVEHFEFPPRHTAVIGDATAFVASEVEKLQPSLPGSAEEEGEAAIPGQYDFIVHDVFTGGVEPAELFTVEFLSGLRALLQPQGTIAINYAGDLQLPVAQMVLRTILAVFPSCRIFRETAAYDKNNSDQTNVVVFCRNVKGPFKFRRPEEVDLLQSGSRKVWLVPKHEVKRDSFMPQCAAAGTCLASDSSDSTELLWRKNVPELEKWRAEAGKRHWELMREVVPPAVWDNW